MVTTRGAGKDQIRLLRDFFHITAAIVSQPDHFYAVEKGQNDFGEFVLIRDVLRQESFQDQVVSEQSVAEFLCDEKISVDHVVLSAFRAPVFRTRGRPPQQQQQPQRPNQPPTFSAATALALMPPQPLAPQRPANSATETAKKRSISDTARALQDSSRAAIAEKHLARAVREALAGYEPGPANALDKVAKIRLFLAIRRARFPFLKAATGAESSRTSFSAQPTSSGKSLLQRSPRHSQQNETATTTPRPTRHRTTKEPHPTSKGGEKA